MELTTKCELCDYQASFYRDIKDRPLQGCKNEECLLFGERFVIGSPLPKVLKVN
jgi:hypothetical protein